MRRKAIGTCVLLLGLLLGTASSAHADTISLTSVSVINFQITPASGTLVLLASQFGSPTSASGANSRAVQNEVPEPATVVLLVSGLGFMMGFVKKRRRR